MWFASADVGDLSRTLIRIRDNSLVTRLSQGAYTSFWSDRPTRARRVEGILTVYRSMLAPQPAAHTLPREAAE